jgi:glucose-6-phosphate isomerase
MTPRSPAWRALRAHHRQLRDAHLRDLFASDPRRGETFSAEGAGLYLDYSKNRVTAETIDLLVALADAAGLRDRIDAMFRGEHLNVTEDRAVLHVALRAPESESIVADGVDVVPAVHDVLDRMGGFATRVRGGEWRGATGERIRFVINIGIGGSDLGPAMAYDALRAFADPAISCRFVSNVDGADLTSALADVDPAATLFVI